MASTRSNRKSRQASAKRRARTNVSSANKRWPSDDEQTMEALRAGLIDALVIPNAARDRIYALKTFEELEQANAELRESQERLLRLVNERERLMQDLHDGCIQSIYAVGLGLDECRDLIGIDPALAEQNLAQAQASLNLVIQELRAFISGQNTDRPVDLSREIRRISKTVGARGPRIAVDIDAKVAGSLSRDRAAQLLQIAREGLANIVRHAKARAARISLCQRGRTVRLEVADDGVGFNTKGKEGKGLGLHHIAARVRKLGGRLEVNSTLSKGSSIVVEIPAV